MSPANSASGLGDRGQFREGLKAAGYPVQQHNYMLYQIRLGYNKLDYVNSLVKVAQIRQLRTTEKLYVKYFTDAMFEESEDVRK